VGDAATAMDLCERALAAGVFAQGIRPPTVPEGSSRLRFTVMATHREAELRAAAVFVGDAARGLGTVSAGDAPAAFSVAA
jgi:8-amino-7-oxononanoate synthase